ncbi:hypothetical protein MHYP_G00189630 [Metynnis hypsauchen]
MSVFVLQTGECKSVGELSLAGLADGERAGKLRVQQEAELKLTPAAASWVSVPLQLQERARNSNDQQGERYRESEQARYAPTCPEDMTELSAPTASFKSSRQNSTEE